MDKNFWLEKWKSNDIAFHQQDANPQLVKHFSKLALKEGDRVFVPLCGKTLDIAWLLHKGCRVVGAELAESAIEELFANLRVKVQISQAGKFKHYTAESIDIFVGDFFDLSGEQLGGVDAVYDRAALVALPDEMRIRYAKHLMNITGKAPQLLITYEYDQNKIPGPPFSLKADEVKQHYSNSYQLELVESVEVPGGLKGKCPAIEKIWLLSNFSNRP